MANPMGRTLLGSLLRPSSRGGTTIPAASLFSSSAASSSSSSLALLSARRLSSYSASNFRSVLGSVHLYSRASSCLFPSYLPRLLLSTGTSSSDDAEDLDEAPLPGESFVSSSAVVSFCEFLCTFVLFGGS